MPICTNCHASLKPKATECPMDSHTLFFGTKPVPIERYGNLEHSDMHLLTEILMVPELWFNGSNGCANFLIKNIDFLEPISRELKGA